MKCSAGALADAGTAEGGGSTFLSFVVILKGHGTLACAAGLPGRPLRLFMIYFIIISLGFLPGARIQRQTRR